MSNSQMDADSWLCCWAFGRFPPPDDDDAEEAAVRQLARTFEEMEKLQKSQCRAAMPPPVFLKRKQMLSTIEEASSDEDTVWNEEAILQYVKVE